MSAERVTVERLIRTALLVPMDNPNSPTCRWGLPLLLWGSPGIGKSARIKAASNSIQLPCETTFPATRAPEDFSGALFIKGEELTVECILGAVRRLLKKDGANSRGVLFLDEVSCAPQAVQAALLSVVLDRCVGDTDLPPGVRILSAANPPHEAAGGWDLTPPMANRFAHMDYPMLTVAEWTRWLSGEEEEEVESLIAGESLVKANWVPSWAKATGIMMGFMHTAGTLYEMPPQGHPDRTKAWPSPRSWEMATRAVATCLALGESQHIQMQFVKFCVGKGQAAAWSEWVDKADLPNPKDMCTRGWAPDKKRIDRTVAALRAMSGFVLSIENEEDRVKMAGGAWRVLQKVDDAGQLDVAIPCAKQLVQAKLDYETHAELKEHAKPVLLRIGKTNIVPGS